MSEKNQETPFGKHILKLFQAISELLAAHLLFIYCIFESIYLTIVPKEPKSVHKEIVLITGSGHGMGRELALLYAKEGATVVGWDINQETLAKTTEDIEKLGGKGFHFLCDVTNREKVLAVAKQVREKVGDVTILINNAGIMPTNPLLQQSHQDIERTMNINVMAHFWTLEAFLPKMKENNHGHIVSMSSVAGLFGVENLVPYCCSKFAVRGLMEALHEELRKNKNNRIQTTSIHPFMVDTGLCKKPRIKYEQFLPVLSIKTAARAIMAAQRTDMNEVSIPRFVFYGNNFMRLLPAKVRHFLCDSTGIGLDL